MISWAMAHGYKWLRSSGLNYDPKLHMRHLLDPTDLHQTHFDDCKYSFEADSKPLIEPTSSYDPTPQEIPKLPRTVGCYTVTIASLLPL